MSPWGFDPAGIDAPVLVVAGGRDRVIPPGHADRLIALLSNAERWSRPQDGHVSVLAACPAAIDWLLARSLR